MTTTIPVADPHVAPEDRPRLSRHSAAILAMLQEGPRTIRELMDGSGSIRVGARIWDLRVAGYRISVKIHNGGLSVYSLVED